MKKSQSSYIVVRGNKTIDKGVISFKAPVRKKSKAAEFGKRLAKAMLKIGSSHVYFIIQQAYKGKQWGRDGEEMSWEDAERIFKEVIDE
jgi:hypothetical protein